MRIQKPDIANGSWRFHPRNGFTTLQLVITMAFFVIMSSFAIFGINSARASMRLASSTRELAGYLEKARTNAIRRNDISIVTIVDANTYTVDMDFDGDGAREVRTVRLQDGVTFTAGTLGAIAQFDWRGKTTSQVGIVLTNGRQMSIHVSGSGDITLNGEIFIDTEIGTINLNSNISSTVANNNSGSPSATPSPSGSPSQYPSPSPSPGASPYPSPSPSPTISPYPSPSPSPSGSPGASPTPSPSPGSSPSPSPSPIGCSISFPSSPMNVVRNAGSKTFTVTVNNANNTVVTATTIGQFTVTPATTTISGSGTISYILRYPTGHNTGTLTIASVCGTTTITLQTTN